MTGRRRQEDTDIDQYLYPALEAVGIPLANIRRNVTTRTSGRQRGDLWVADVPHASPDFEERILALVECKDRAANLDDADWSDAKAQGKRKATSHSLGAFFVTNTVVARCYNTSDLTEVTVDGNVLTQVPSLPLLRSIQTQIKHGISNVAYRSFSKIVPNPNRFRSSLWNLRQIFRSAGVGRGSEDSIIKTTLTFCILKIISEQQQTRRTIPKTVYLWQDWREGQIDRDIRNCIADITALPEYSHLVGCLEIHSKLDIDNCKKFRKELDQYVLYDSDFDFFGIIYESMANKDLKKDFGEFYTPRHIIQFMVSTLLQGERVPRPLSICDPACGTGGFLVEAFLFLKKQYEDAKRLDEEVFTMLKEQTFHGFDTNADVAIPYARTNMMMAGDGGANIVQTQDTLLESKEGAYDYILANIPYGAYAGNAEVSSFSYANSRRYEILFLEKVVSFLKDGGSAAIIVPDSIVEATSYARVRQNFLFDVQLNAVISLPPFVFEPYTTEKTYILYFDKKMPQERGRFQTGGVWHCVIDADGFQDGKKRYPINEDDFPAAKSGFLSASEQGRCGFVGISDVSAANFFSLCSEYHLRRPVPTELPPDDFERLLRDLEGRV